MEMETSLQQKMAPHLAEMKTSYAEMEARTGARQERADARQEKANAEMKASQERASAEMKAVHAEIKATYAEMEARAEAPHERFLAFLDGLTSYGKGTATCHEEVKSCSEEIDATRLETNSGAAEAAVERQKFRENEINAENILSSEYRSGYQRLVLRSRRGAKKRTQDSVGSRQKLSAARNRVICRAVPTMSKGQMRKSPGKDRTMRGAPKRRRLKNI
jgi:hypothetical protein